MWEPLQKQFLALSLKTSAALLYAGEGRLFILRSLSIFKKENILKSFDFRTFGGDKRDRTADLLNAIQALSQLSYTPKWYVLQRTTTICYQMFSLLSTSFFNFFIFSFLREQAPKKHLFPQRKT